MKIDNILLEKILKKVSKRKITDSTFTKYLKKSRIQVLNKTQRTVFNNSDISCQTSPLPQFTNSMKVQKIHLISQRQNIFNNHSKRDFSCASERNSSIKFPSHSSNHIKTGFSTQTTKSKVNSFRPDQATTKHNYLNMPKLRKNFQKMAIKEALKNNEWNIKTKPELERLWRVMINKSNGLEDVSSCGTYKVYIGKGNNSALIKKIFKNRSWWTITKNYADADFIWTQWKSDEVIAQLGSGSQLSIIKKEAYPGAFLWPIQIKGDDNTLKTVDIEELGFHLIRNSKSYTFAEGNPLLFRYKLYNRMEFNHILTDKKGLLQTMTTYYKSIKQDPFDCMPMSYHVKNDQDPNFEDFLSYFSQLEAEKHSNFSQNLWIIKPGECSNRGQGITICNSIAQIKSVLSNIKDSSRSFIFQKYIENPFLIHRRKFDIRCYTLVTSINSVIQAYFYIDGYIRTASVEFSTKDINDNFKHLTNDAIQKHGEEYGKYEDGNKLSYREFQRYLDNHFHDRKISFFSEILPKIKHIVKDTIKASFRHIDNKKRLNSMEILGYDFMVDQNFKPWLIEINTNPCLELSSSLLGVVIPAMVENAIRLAVDPIFPPSSGKNLDNIQKNKFELIFHELIDGEELNNSLPQSRSRNY